MKAKPYLIFILMVLLISLFFAMPLHARGILGDDSGDRSASDNDIALKEGIKHIRLAIKASNDGVKDMSLQHGKDGLLALKEISSEGWASRIERCFKTLLLGIGASRKGNLEKASMHYQVSLQKVEALKFGDMIYTHDSFMGIGDHK